MFFAFAFVLPVFGQSDEQIERELVGHIKNIQKWSSYANPSGEDSSEKLSQENETFKDKLLKYTKQPATLKYEFKELDELISIATTEDGRFRIYSWDTETGGTMHFFEKVYQFQGADGRVYSKTDNLTEGDAGSFVYDIFTIDTNNGKVYLVCTTAILSTSDAYQSVKLFKIENDSLNDQVRLIKTQTSVKNSLGFEYDFFSVVDREERPVKLIHYDKAAKAIKMPVVLKDEKFRYGRVTDKFIVYKYNGQHFVKTK